MDLLGLGMIYLGTGAALGWLRRRQGQGLGDTLFAILAWPLDWLGGWLALINDAASCREP